MKKNSMLFPLAIGIVIVFLGVFLCVTTLLSKSLPSNAENSLAAKVGLLLQEEIENERQSIFCGASRDSIRIEAYGFVDQTSQLNLIDKIKKVREDNPFYGRVYLIFFPSREYVTTYENGSVVSELIKNNAIRRFEIK